MKCVGFSKRSYAIIATGEGFDGNIVTPQPRLETKLKFVIFERKFRINQKRDKLTYEILITFYTKTNRMGIIWEDLAHVFVIRMDTFTVKFSRRSTGVNVRLISTRVSCTCATKVRSIIRLTFITEREPLFSVI